MATELETIAERIAALTASIDNLATVIVQRMPTQQAQAPIAAKFNVARNSQLLGAL